MIRKYIINQGGIGSASNVNIIPVLDNYLISE